MATLAAFSESAASELASGDQWNTQRSKVSMTNLVVPRVAVRVRSGIEPLHEYDP